MRKLFFGIVGLSLALFSNHAIASNAFQEHLKPGSIRYSDQGAHPTKGRDGCAALRLSATIDGSGGTELNIQAEFDFADPNCLYTGQIPTLSKIQIKAFTSDGRLLFSLNEQSLSSPSLIKTLRGILPHQTIQVQALIDGVDRTRKNVVTASTNVHYQPDLEVGDLQLPQKIVQYYPNAIFAEVRELKGDLGANFDCVLYVDDVEVDRIYGSWVDAGDKVSCLFSHEFLETGSHSAYVRAENVAPNEYNDSSNQSKTAFLAIEQMPEVDGSFHSLNCKAASSEGTSYRWEDYYVESGGLIEVEEGKTAWFSNGQSHHHETEQSFEQRSVSCGADSGEYLIFPVNVQASFLTDGESFYSPPSQEIPMSGQFVYGDYLGEFTKTLTCGTQWEFSTGFSGIFTVCTDYTAWKNGETMQSSTMSVYWIPQSRTTYLSEGYFREWSILEGYPDRSYEYENSWYIQNFEPPLAIPFLGEEFSYSIVAEGGPVRISVDGTLPVEHLPPENYDSGPEPICDNWEQPPPDGGNYDHYCFIARDTGIGARVEYVGPIE